MNVWSEGTRWPGVPEAIREMEPFTAWVAA